MLGQPVLSFDSAVSAGPVNLFAASYAGNISTLSFGETPGGNYSLTNLFSSPAPVNTSWLTLDKQHGILYSVDEALNLPNGSVSSFSVDPDGSLKPLNRVTSITGDVSSVIYGKDDKQRALAVAEYAGNALSTFSISDNGSISALQDFTFTIATKGPNPVRQEAPHPHQVLVDPTGNFIIIPDLGADLVWIFSIDHQTNLLKKEEPLQAMNGSGPRHAAFWSPGHKLNRTDCSSDDGYSTVMYLVGELQNTVTAYAITYPHSGGMQFKLISSLSTYGPYNCPFGALAAEIAPDGKQVLVSNRFDHTFNVTIDGGASEPSDSFATFAIDPASGALAFRQLHPAGGLAPRQFQLNRAGDRLAIALQRSSRVVVLARNEDETSWMRVAEACVEGEVVCVIWDN